MWMLIKHEHIYSPSCHHLHHVNNINQAALSSSPVLCKSRINYKPGASDATDSSPC